jgi:hypothetical protein
MIIGDESGNVLAWGKQRLQRYACCHGIMLVLNDIKMKDVKNSEDNR